MRCPSERERDDLSQHLPFALLYQICAAVSGHAGNLSPPFWWLGCTPVARPGNIVYQPRDQGWHTFRSRSRSRPSAQNVLFGRNVDAIYGVGRLVYRWYTYDEADAKEGP